MLRAVATRLLFGLPFLGCAGEDAGESVGSRKEPIVLGTASTDAQNAVVALDHIVPTSDPNVLSVESCTATLVAPNVVLTARHCVSPTAGPLVECDAQGRGNADGQVSTTFPADTLYVFYGKERGKRTPSAAAARGAKILHDGATNLCNHDLALVVLDKAAGPMFAPMRLDATVKVGDTVTAIGWGLNESSAVPGARLERADVSVTFVGPFLDTKVPVAVPSHEFVIGESVCLGDSGGPALDSQSHAVVGVVSRGGGDANFDPKAPARSCMGNSVANYITSLAPFKDTILKALGEAGAKPWLEGAPDPRLLASGAACRTNEACQSGLCLLPEGQCVESCEKASCPNGLLCSQRALGSVCTAPPTTAGNTTGGCHVSTSGSPNSVGWFFLALCGLGRWGSRKTPSRFPSAAGSTTTAASRRAGSSVQCRRGAAAVTGDDRAQL